MNSCVVCYRESELLCQRCRTPYCSRKCQAEDWPEHKSVCIPMPPLVAAKKKELHPKRPTNESHKPNQQTYDSQKSKQQTYDSQKPKQQTYDSQKSKQQTNDLQKSKQQTNDLQKSKQQTNDSLKPKQANDLQKPRQQTNDSQTKQQTCESLRAPKTKLPSEITLPTDSKVSLFDNPFKRNSQNIAFKANDINNNPSSTATKLPSVNETEKTETNAQACQNVAVDANESKNEPLHPVAKMPSVNETEKIKTKVHLSPGELNPVVSTISETFHASVKTSAAKDEKAEIIVPQPTPEKRSLKEKLKEVVEPQQVNEAEENILTMSDIEIIPLAAGKKIVCLDSTNIADGYISSCVNDGKAVAFIDRLSAKITDYCNRTKDCYRPQYGELCLCLFDEDNEWYRAVVTKKIDSDTFEISFIDFGNVETACSKNIRKMPREFLHHCLVNKCYIKGFPDESTESKLKVQEFFTNNPIFEASKMEHLKNGVYRIELLNC